MSRYRSRSLGGRQERWETLILLDFRHKKRRPWTSLDDDVVGRGNLNRFIELLTYNSLKIGDLSGRPFSFYINTCACNRLPTTSNKSQSSRSEVTSTAPVHCEHFRLRRSSPTIGLPCGCGRPRFRALRRRFDVDQQRRNAVIDAGDRHVSIHDKNLQSVKKRAATQGWLVDGVSGNPSGGSKLSSARFTNSSATTASCWIASATLRRELSRSQARSVLMTLSEARVSQA